MAERERIFHDHVNFASHSLLNSHDHGPALGRRLPLFAILWLSSLLKRLKLAHKQVLQIAVRMASVNCIPSGVSEPEFARVSIAAAVCARQGSYRPAAYARYTPP